jgi:hypothetical protein
LDATQRSDGDWRAVHAHRLCSENTLIGPVYHAELRSQVQKLGFQTEIGGKHESASRMSYLESKPAPLMKSRNPNCALALPSCKQQQMQLVASLNS